MDRLSRISDMTSYFQDGGHDVILRSQVLPSGECTSSVCPEPAAWPDCPLAILSSSWSSNAASAITYTREKTRKNACGTREFLVQVDLYGFLFLERVSELVKIQKSGL